jgi:hypothetical protein
MKNQRGSLDTAMALLNKVARTHHPMPAVPQRRRFHVEHRKVDNSGFKLGARLDQKSLDNLKLAIRK